MSGYRMYLGTVLWPDMCPAAQRAHEEQLEHEREQDRARRDGECPVCHGPWDYEHGRCGAAGCELGARGYE